MYHGFLFTDGVQGGVCSMKGILLVFYESLDVVKGGGLKEWQVYY
jgi:hypothetical protein